MIYFYLEDYDNYGIKTVLYLYFLSFYIIFETLRKTFCILIITEYQARAHKFAEMDMALIDNFNACWSKVNGKHEISLSKLFTLIKVLHAPLGLQSITREVAFSNLDEEDELLLSLKDKEVNFFDLCRAVKKVLLCMPNVSSFEGTIANDWARTPQYNWEQLR